MSKILDWHKQTGSALFGGVRGGGSLLKLEKNEIFVTMNGWSDLNEIWYLEGSCALELLF